MIKIPPVLILLISVIAMWLLDRFMGAGQVSIPFQGSISALLLTLGFVVTFTGVWSFRKASTTVDPLHPKLASQLVTSGVYMFTRNPMYLGMLLVLLSWLIYLGNFINLGVVILFVWFINRYQIPPEEEALGKLFDEQYREYCSRVRRWI